MIIFLFWVILEEIVSFFKKNLCTSYGRRAISFLLWKEWAFDRVSSAWKINVADGKLLSLQMETASHSHVFVSCSKASLGCCIIPFHLLYFPSFSNTGEAERKINKERLREYERSKCSPSPICWDVDKKEGKVRGRESKRSTRTNFTQEECNWLQKYCFIKCQLYCDQLFPDVSHYFFVLFFSFLFVPFLSFSLKNAHAHISSETLEKNQTAWNTPNPHGTYETFLHTSKALNKCPLFSSSSLQPCVCVYVDVSHVSDGNEECVFGRMGRLIGNKLWKRWMIVQDGKMLQTKKWERVDL